MGFLNSLAKIHATEPQGTGLNVTMNRISCFNNTLNPVMNIFNKSKTRHVDLYKWYLTFGMSWLAFLCLTTCRRETYSD